MDEKEIEAVRIFAREEAVKLYAPLRAELLLQAAELDKLEKRIAALELAGMRRVDYDGLLK